MAIEKLVSGHYFVPGRNGKPGRSTSKLAEAQAYDKELDACACIPNPTNDSALEADDYLADVVEAYLQALNDGVLYAEMELRSACTAYRTTRTYNAVSFTCPGCGRETGIILNGSNCPRCLGGD